MQSARTAIQEAYQGHCERAGKPPTLFEVGNDITQSLKRAIDSRTEAMSAWGFAVDKDGNLSYEGVPIQDRDDLPTREVRVIWKESQVKKQAPKPVKEKS